MPILVPPSGPIPARIMIVGEAPGADEEVAGRPFVGSSGNELTTMLERAGINRGECFITNVAKERPYQNDINNFIAKTKKQAQEHPHDYTSYRGKFVKQPIIQGIKLLSDEINAVKPLLIIALGGTALWALTGNSAITKWRGSMLHCDLAGVQRTKVVPTLHPAAVLRQWNTRNTVIADLKRAKKWSNHLGDFPKPKWNFRVKPTLAKVRECFDEIWALLEQRPTLLSFDIETRFSHISCAGIAWSLVDALCIPLMMRGTIEGYWSADEEAWIIFNLWKILTHPNARVIGQNIIYDSQYTWRYWHFVPRVTQDTMISQHSIWSDQPKALYYICSLHCDNYIYWKEDK